ncbi:3153_t:CDS:1, partial [Gigaspora rosea]
KQRSISEVWDFFKKVKWKKIKKTAKCDILKYTHKEFFCESGGSTKILWRHLESAHWSQYITTIAYRNKKKKVQDEHCPIKEIFKE